MNWDDTRVLALRVKTGIALCLLFFAFGLTDASGEDGGEKIAKAINLSGPRVGVTAVFGSIAKELTWDSAEECTVVAGVETCTTESTKLFPLISQFGWQFEKRFATAETGFTGIAEGIVLVGGAEQGAFIPSATGVIGVRTPTGVEFGIGPNVTPLGVSLVFAGGMTFRLGYMFVPVNLAIVPTYTDPMGVRISLLTGFNLAK